MSQKIRAAVIGGTEDGKTTLAAGLSRGLWRTRRFRSVVFDPFRGETDWGPQALVIGPTKAQVKSGGADLIEREFGRFRRLARSLDLAHRTAVFWDEGTDTGGRDRDNLGLFTAIRHSTEAFFFIGHGFSTMLPLMRGSLTDVLLAVRDPDDAREWARLFCDEAVMQATALRQYEFLHKRKHRPARVLRFTAEQLRAGVTLPP